MKISICFVFFPHRHLLYYRLDLCSLWENMIFWEIDFVCSHALEELYFVLIVLSFWWAILLMYLDGLWNIDAWEHQWLRFAYQGWIRAFFSIDRRLNDKKKITFEWQFVHLRGVEINLGISFNKKLVSWSEDFERFLI